MNFTDYLRGCDVKKLKKLRKLVSEELKKKKRDSFILEYNSRKIKDKK